jgi:hypothetical protein
MPYGLPGLAALASEQCKCTRLLQTRCGGMPPYWRPRASDDMLGYTHGGQSATTVSVYERIWHHPTKPPA